MPPNSFYIVEGKRVNGLVRTEPEGMAYDAFRALGMRVPRRVPEAGEGERCCGTRGQCVRKPLIPEDFFARGVEVRCKLFF